MEGALIMAMRNILYSEMSFAEGKVERSSMPSSRARACVYASRRSVGSPWDGKRNRPRSNNGQHATLGTFAERCDLGATAPSP
jgi:hypothetical protein